MKRIEDIGDEMQGFVTYELPDGRYARFDVRAVREHGLAAMAKEYGITMPTERVPVWQYGRRVGTVPGDFDIAFARSNHFLYDVRPGDLKREGDHWVADRTLGASDLDCLVGFVRDQRS